MTAAPEYNAPIQTARDGNGVLARVPSEYIAKACKSLPDAATAPDDEMRVEVDAAWLGRVRLTFTKHRYRRPKGKFSSVFWSCGHAEAVARPGVGASTGPEGRPELDVGSSLPT